MTFFAIKLCGDGGAKSEHRCQDAFNNACERTENAIFKAQSGVCLSLELCFPQMRGASFHNNDNENEIELKNKGTCRGKVKGNEYARALRHSKGKAVKR